MPFNVTPADLAAALADQIDHLKPDWVTERLERICKLIRLHITKPQVQLGIAYNRDIACNPWDFRIQNHFVHATPNFT